MVSFTPWNNKCMRCVSVPTQVSHIDSIFINYSILDGILDGPREESAFAKARKTLLEKLSGRWAALAVDRVGNHTVKKLFKGLMEWEDKAVLTSEMAQALNRLGGNAMGRSVIEACSVSEFMEGEEAWKSAVRKMERHEELIDDILAIGDEEKKDEKKKRKRKKHKKRDSAEKDDGEERAKKSRVGDVESIMNVISMGTKSN